MDTPRPAATVAVVTVRVVSPLPAVAAGLRTMLTAHPAVAVVDEHHPLPSDPDVVLYDAHALVDGGADLERLLATPSLVLAVCNGLRPALAGEASARGAHGTIDLGTDRDGLVESVLSAIGAARSGASGPATGPGSLRRLGASAGLTPREVDVLSQITQGLSNQEIAEQSYLSINSVKTYIRSAYRRIGVTSRAQAVVWCVQNGFPSMLAA
ncbi:helix-turn-helix transcriptional regulator [Nocardioides plantarum]|uniref:LuxR C-terminal-related transcriptional regulator n=1 Tax=Nocardioides plantarum TaxID=29299 RepID=A0ABV5KCY3_9ACTN|nr:response regulator transcription factor [Nocardioides plantarum]